MHWSYADKADGDLVQGDILLPNDALRASFEVAHPWFLDPKYLGFVVISQTCDLVRREGAQCKTPYLEVSAVRSLRSCLFSLLKHQCDWIGDRYFPSVERNKANDLLDRIINQNEAALGLFYLHPESEIGIAEESVALLRVSVALRSEQHYDTLVSARKGRLDPEFANKMGWLCGNLYSRIGIKDWKESEEDKAKATEIRGKFLNDPGEDGPLFIDCPKPFMDARRKRQFDLSASTPDEIKSKIAEFEPKPFKDKALASIARILTAQGIEPSVVETVKKRLNNDTEFSGTIRPGK